ncbi:DEAD/DEAH box helicase family protein [Heliorestis acidaminivorans]|uniref:DEAD/DEAH box helicase family protein n=1 Tax=Heliorestis acidaminivorans TaxID=553427 RepID=UPI001478FE97|nr:DEAD/DEAH box helicase family protein [Heliorestis acidaminivorans]
MYHKPLIVHRNGKVFLIQDHDPYGHLAQKLTDFADMIKIPEGVSTFELSSYALWSAAAKGYNAKNLCSFLKDNACNTLDSTLESMILQNMRQYNSLKLFRHGKYLALQAVRPEIILEILKDKPLEKKVVKKINDCTLLFNASEKVELKKQLFKKEFFAIDSTNEMGKELDINLLNITRRGQEFKLRDYQIQAARAFLDNKDKAGGGGIVIMPPRSGKTFVGFEIIGNLKLNTLIITENHSSATSWKEEVLDKTDLAEESILLYNSNQQGLEPITITTYPYLSANSEAFEHLAAQEWGLIIYDDAHKLPAKKNMATADIPSKYKLALAATLARSDEQGTLVYALIGPKWYEILPQTLRGLGYLSNIDCAEVKVPLSEKAKEEYTYIEMNGNDHKALRKVAAENDKKKEALVHLIKPQKRTAIASYYKELAKQIGQDYQIDYVTGEINPKIRLNLVEKFNTEEINCLVFTLVGEQFNLQNLDVLIAISYQGGSAREEYLRLGKLMEVNKKGTNGWFFSIISTETLEESDYKGRRRSLINYGYRFKILELKDLEEGEIIS